MSATVNTRRIKTDAGSQPSLSNPESETTPELSLPDSAPQSETTIFRTPERVIRIQPIQSSTAEFCLVMYLLDTEVTEDLTPAHTSNWDDIEYDTSPNTVKALPDTIHNQYGEILDSITEQWGLTIVRPTTGDGICHRRHDVGTDGVVSFKTHLG